MPKIIDLIAIYHETNKLILHEIIDKIFELNNAYKNDFKDSVKIIHENIINTIYQDLIDLKKKESFIDPKKPGNENSR